jgi:hypothetical protein
LTVTFPRAPEAESLPVPKPVRPLSSR